MCYNNKELSTEAVKAMNGRQNSRFKCELGFWILLIFGLFFYYFGEMLMKRILYLSHFIY